MKHRVHKKLNIFLVSIVLLLVMSMFALTGIFEAFSFTHEYAEADAVNAVEEVPQAAFTKPTTLEELRAADPEDVAGLEQYDARDYGLITEVKDQGSEGICWAFATLSACETNLILKGLATAESIDLNERNLAYNMVNSPDDTSNDEKWNAGNWMLSTASLFTQWRGLNNQNVDMKDMSYGTGDYIMTDMICVDNDIRSIKTAVAKYGSVTFAFDSSEITDYYYKSEPGTGHAVTIIGWDDHISKNKFSPEKPSNNGAWIIKNSWGSWHGIDGYDYFSYELPITGIVTFECESASEYDHNYNNETSNWSCFTYEPTMPQDSNNPKIGNIYQVESSNSGAVQVLKAVNIGADITYNADTSFKIDVYTGLKPYSNSNPTAGTLRSTTVTNFTYSGYHTVKLDEPVDLQDGDWFSVVLSYDPSSSVYRDEYGNHDNRFSSLYWTESGGWSTTYTGTYYYVARIKAWTTDIRRGSNVIKERDLSNATITVEGTPVYDGSEKKPLITVKCDGKTLALNSDYTVTYKNNINAGTATVTVKGVGYYGGEKSATFTIAKAEHPYIMPRDMIIPEDKDNIDFALPFGWEFADRAAYRKALKKEGASVEAEMNYTAADKNNYEVTYAKVKLTMGTAGDIDIDGSKIKVTVDDSNLFYNGTAQLPDLTVTYTTKSKTTVLTEGKDYVWGCVYTASYDRLYSHEIVDVGDYTGYIYGIGSYYSWVAVDFTVHKATMTDVPNDVTIGWDTDLKDVYWGEGWSLKARVNIDCGSTKTVTLIHDDANHYENPEAQVNVTRDYAPVLGERVSINDCNIALSNNAFDYTGGVIKPNVTVTHNGYKLQNGVDYTLTYENNVKVGTAKVTIKGIADFMDSTEKTFTINAANCNHSYTSTIIKEPTCSEEGCKTYTCTKCGYSYDETIAKTAHTVATWVDEIPATCSHEGSRTETVYCTVCGTVTNTTSTPIEKLDHIAGTAVRENYVAATCKQVGGYNEVTYCTVCGEKTTSTYHVIDKVAHKGGNAVRENEVEATCTQVGSYDEVVRCTVCNEIITSTHKEIAKAAHKGGNAVRENEVEATCIQAGGYDEVIYCTVCGEKTASTHKEITQAAHKGGNAVRENEVEATCTQVGSYDEVVRCTVCNEIINSTHKEITQAAHKGGNAVRENVVNATCTQAGSYDEVVYCTECHTEMSRTQKIVEQKPHNYVDGICTDCGDSIIQPIEPNPDESQKSPLLGIGQNTSDENGGVDTTVILVVVGLVAVFAVALTVTIVVVAKIRKSGKND